MTQTSSTKALWQGKCPRCHQGNVFKNSVYSSGFTRMYENCPRCGADFQNEPGFYFGAMFVSYAFTVAIFVACWITLRVLFDPSLTTYFIVIVGAAVVTMPPNFRYSRLLWLYWFGGHSYDPNR